MLKATPFEYVNFSKSKYASVQKVFIEFKHDLFLLDAKLGGALRITIAFLILSLVHQADFLKYYPPHKNYSYPLNSLGYWVCITYGMNIAKDVVSSNIHPSDWKLTNANTDDAAQATVYSLFSILLLQSVDYGYASKYPALGRFLILAGANALWLMSTSFLRGKDKATILFNSLRSIIGGIIATPLSMILHPLGMTDTVLQSKTSSELVGGLGEGTIRYFKGVSMRRHRDIGGLVKNILTQPTDETAVIENMLSIIRIWSKVSFGKSALRHALLDQNISYAQVQMFLFAFSKKDKFIRHIQGNRDNKRKPEKLKILYEKDIDNFNRWVLKILIKKSRQPKIDSSSRLQDKYAATVVSLNDYSFLEQKELFQSLAVHDLKEATLLLLCLAKKDYQLFVRILKEWDKKYLKQKREIINLIKN